MRIFRLVLQRDCRCAQILLFNVMYYSLEKLNILMQEKALLLHTSFENNLVSVEYFFHISTLSCVYL